GRAAGDGAAPAGLGPRRDLPDRGARRRRRRRGAGGARARQHLHHGRRVEAAPRPAAAARTAAAAADAGDPRRRRRADRRPPRRQEGGGGEVIEHVFVGVALVVGLGGGFLIARSRLQHKAKAATVHRILLPFTGTE